MLSQLGPIKHFLVGFTRWINIRTFRESLNQMLDTICRNAAPNLPETPTMLSFFVKYCNLKYNLLLFTAICILRIWQDCFLTASDLHRTALDLNITCTRTWEACQQPAGICCSTPTSAATPVNLSLSMSFGSTNSFTHIIYLSFHYYLLLLFHLSPNSIIISIIISVTHPDFHSYHIYIKSIMHRSY